MLQDELFGIRQFIEEITVPYRSGPEASGCMVDHRLEIAAMCGEIREAWKAAGFSDAPDHSLKRYFSYHLEGIREISDTLFETHAHTEQLSQLQQELTGLIDYQRKNFRHFFEENAVAPKAYSRNLAETLAAAVQVLTADLEGTAVDEKLKESVLSFLNEMLSGTGTASFTFRALFYFESMVVALHGLNLAKAGEQTDRLLAGKLASLNFNHLGFFCYCRSRILRKADQADPWKKLEILEEELAALKYTENHTRCYDPAWPSLNEMLYGWITEESSRTRELLRAEENALVQKLPLNLSVAQLAFLLKLLSQENLLDNPNLTEVFKFFSRNFETKRQKSISAGSLSKEYYSTGQVTAAVVRDMLQKMIARIDRNFFP